MYVHFSTTIKMTTCFLPKPRYCSLFSFSFKVFAGRAGVATHGEGASALLFHPTLDGTRPEPLPRIISNNTFSSLGSTLFLPRHGSTPCAALVFLFVCIPITHVLFFV